MKETGNTSNSPTYKILLQAFGAQPLHKEKSTFLQHEGAALRKLDSKLLFVGL